MRRKWVILLLSMAAIVVVGFALWSWEMRQFSKNLKSIDAKKAETVMFGSMADIVLDESVLRDFPSQRGGILNQYQENPSTYDEKAKLVITWTRASTLVKAASLHQIPTSSAISSSALEQVSPGDRVDAWDKPFCLYSAGTKVVVLSGGGKSQLQCDSLNLIAKRLANTVNTKKLIKDHTGLYALVSAVDRQNLRVAR